MSVQDIVEAYETRLRERWTPDGHRILICPNGAVVIDATKEQKVRIGTDGWVNVGASMDGWGLMHQHSERQEEIARQIYDTRGMEKK